MQESKFYASHWKKWKHTLYLLESTKEDLQSDVKATSYSDELPGGSHKSVFEKYNKLLEQLEVYDQHIKMYRTVINHFEKCLNEKLTKEQRQVVIIYANNPGKGQSNKRELIANQNGYSTASYYRTLEESFKLLDEVLDIKSINT